MSKRRERDVARRTFPSESRLECARAHVGGLLTTLRRLERDAAGRGADGTRENLRRALRRARCMRDDVSAARQEVRLLSLLNLWIPVRWPYLVFQIWGLESARRGLGRCVRGLRTMRARRADGRA